MWSVEVADGRFTLSASSARRCGSINWLKLDLLSSTLYSPVWLPAPQKEWWQLELDDATVDAVGLVEIRLPHEEFTTASSYPNTKRYGTPDCRQWWLYAPAKCYRMFMAGRKLGVHPALATYPDFPGFTRPFLEWLFDMHDTNGDGEWTYAEFKDAQSQQALTGTYGMWERHAPYNISASHNKKGTHGYHEDNAAHLWNRLDVFHKKYADQSATGLGRGDDVITKSELVQGVLARPHRSFCDLFESTAFTHGGNQGAGLCSKTTHGEMPVHWGFFNEDGAHGFVVTMSNTPCSDTGGCPVVGDPGVTLCEIRHHRTSDKPASVDCHGATGKFLQLALPGDGQRLLPNTAVVTAHRSSFPSRKGPGVPDSIASTDPALTTVCYGVVPRPVPAADDPNLLAATKAHPKSIVDDNPEDPIYWSTCYDRVVVKEWLPLEAGGGDSGDDNNLGVRFAFNNNTQCAACDCVRQHIRANNESTGGYDMTTMITPRWWLQAKGSCSDCNFEIFGNFFIKTTALCAVGVEWSATGNAPCAPCKKDAACIPGVKKACVSNADTVCKIAPQVTKVTGASIVLKGVTIDMITEALRAAIISIVARLYGVDVSDATVKIAPSLVEQGEITGVRVEYDVVSTTLTVEHAREVSDNIEALLTELRKTEAFMELALAAPTMIVTAGAPATIRVERHPTWPQDDEALVDKPTSGGGDGGLPLGVLVGASVGGVVVLAAALIGGVMLFRRQMQKRQVKSQTTPTKGREVIHEIHHDNPLRRHPSFSKEGGSSVVAQDSRAVSINT